MVGTDIEWLSLGRYTINGDDYGLDTTNCDGSPIAAGW